MVSVDVKHHVYLCLTHRSHKRTNKNAKFEIIKALFSPSHEHVKGRQTKRTVQKQICYATIKYTVCIFSPDILQAGAVKGLIIHRQLPVFTCEFVLSSVLIVAVLISCCYEPGLVKLPIVG